ncbi:MAG: fumarylacetoacetate hydrolase family protein [Maricaulaceae bacterium]|jgi:fumarylacetoacetate (FAA) hydrolase
MKLASYKKGRDGALHVVSRDLSKVADASDIAPTMQAALDEWEQIEPGLRERASLLERDLVEVSPFDPRSYGPPLPRAFQFADAPAYVHHLALARRARGADLPKSFWSEPVIAQLGSDFLLGPNDPIELPQTERWGVDFEAEVVAILDDTQMGVTPDEARDSIKLLTLANDVSLRGLIPGELAKGAGFYQGKPSTAFAPCAVTPDELGVAWDGGRPHLPLYTKINGLIFGKPNAGVDMTFDFPTLISHAAKTRNLCAGTLIGAGPVSNAGPDGEPGRPVAEGGAGFSCITELRMIETIETGRPITPFLSFGDRIEIEMLDASGRSIFGQIDQRVAQHGRL